MVEPIKTKSNIKPNVFENLGNGKWYYNYNITSQVVDKDLVYSFIQIKLPHKPTYKECVERIIAEYIKPSQEFDLINSYNRITLNNLTDEESVKEKAKYIKYLNKINEIKTNVKKDFE